MLFTKLVPVQVPGPTQYVTREIHEHRAPTDESIRLLKEMEDKAEAKLVESIRLENNGFECVVNVWKEAASGDQLSGSLRT